MPSVVLKLMKMETISAFVRSSWMAKKSRHILGIRLKTESLLRLFERGEGKCTELSSRQSFAELCWQFILGRETEVINQSYKGEKI